MKRTKSFFYVSLGVLALAVAFHLGAESAQGQSIRGLVTGGIYHADDQGMIITAVDDSGEIWIGTSADRRGFGTFAPPKAGNVIALGRFGRPPASNGTMLVLYDDGDVWVRNPDQLYFNIFDGAPVSTQKTTWDRIKAEKR